jgi:hypothetical protein
MEDLDQMGGDILLPGMKQRVKDLWTPAEMHLLARTLEAGDKPLCIMGLSMYWEGVAYAWAFLHPDVANYKLTFVRGGRRLLHWALDAFALNRIQATCLTTPERYGRTLELLGFEREGLMRKYGMDGTDHYLYAFLRP